MPLGRVVRHLPPGLQPPRAPGVGPGTDHRCGRGPVLRGSLAVGHDVKARLGLVVGQPSGQGPRIVRAGFPAVQVVLRDDAVAAQRPAQRFRPRPHPDHPQRDAGLDRPRGRGQVQPAGVVLVVLPVVAGAAVPQRADQVDALIEPRGAPTQVGDLGGIGKIGVDGADSDREDRAAVRHLVQRRHLAGDLPGTAPGQRGEHGAEPDLGRLDRDGGQQAPRVHPVGRLPHEHPVPPGLLGQHRLVQLLGGGPARQHDPVAHDVFGHGPVHHRSPTPRSRRAGGDVSGGG